VSSSWPRDFYSSYSPRGGFLDSEVSQNLEVSLRFLLEVEKSFEVTTLDVWGFVFHVFGLVGRGGFLIGDLLVLLLRLLDFVLLLLFLFFGDFLFVFCS
jgi:hypothetical protein